MAMMTAALVALACAQDAPVELRWKFEPGKEMLYRFNQQQVFEMQGIGMEQSVGFQALMKVVEVAPDGIATVSFTYKGVSARGKGLLDFEYDSEKDKEPPAGAPQAAMMARMVGKSMKMKMKPTGQVVEILDYEKLVEELLAGEENEAAREMMRQMYSSDAVKSQMQGMAPALPEKAVKPGDTWKDSFDFKMPLPMSMAFTTVSTLKSLKDGQATLEQDVKIEFKANPDQPDQALPFEMRDAKGKGTSVFSVERGQFLSHKLVMEMTLVVAGNEMPMKMEQEMTLAEPKRDF